MKTLDWPARRQSAANECCTGACLQGHACPRYAQPEPEPLTCRLRFIVGLLFAAFIWVVTR